MNEDEQWRLYEIMITTVLIVVITFAIFFCVLMGLRDREYNRMLKSCPSINFIEEDLEEVFMTRNVVVKNADINKDEIYYTISANGVDYKVEYKLRQKFIYWEWRYIRHIEIATV